MIHARFAETAKGTMVIPPVECQNFQKLVRWNINANRNCECTHKKLFIRLNNALLVLLIVYN